MVSAPMKRRQKCSTPGYGNWRIGSAKGGIRTTHTMVKGLDQAPLALQEACAGHLKSLVLVELE